jgi:hypothetical protein
VCASELLFESETREAREAVSVRGVRIKKAPKRKINLLSSPVMSRVFIVNELSIPSTQPLTNNTLVTKLFRY